MSTDPIRLHEVEAGQGLPAGGLERLRAQRPHLFPGRALGEDAFDRLQAWGDARIAALEGALPAAGIVAGLDCRLEQQGADQVLRLSPGAGLGQGRELYNLHHALTRTWTGLRDAFRSRPDSPDAALDGLYLVVVDAEFVHLDVDPDQAACRRDELDRLRDARIARALRLELAAVDPVLWDLDEVEQRPLTAANRFLGRLLGAPERRPEHPGVAVALVGARDDALLWLDAAAGAFPALEQPVHAQLRAHLHQAFAQVLRAAARSGDDPLQALADFRPAFLPAAAELPAFLLNDPAGVDPLPRLDWFPVDAALDLQVLPASSLPVVLGANLHRPAPHFDALAGDHYRIGLVLDDADYRDGLLALPRLEAELPDLLRRQGILARNAAAEVQAAWDRLAAGFDPADNPGIEVPDRPAAADDPEAVLQDLAAGDWRAGEAGAQLEPPYSDTWPEPGAALPEALPVSDETPADAADGLLARAADEEARQRRLNEMLAEIAELLELFEQEKKHQRGLVDTLTIDLARFAGGIAGDGSGLVIGSMARQVKMRAGTGNETEGE